MTQKTLLKSKVLIGGRGRDCSCARARFGHLFSNFAKGAVAFWLNKKTSLVVKNISPGDIFCLQRLHERVGRFNPDAHIYKKTLLKSKALIGGRGRD